MNAQDHGGNRWRGRRSNSYNSTYVSEYPNQAYRQPGSSYTTQSFQIKGQGSYSNSFSVPRRNNKHNQQQKSGGSTYTYTPRNNSFGNHSHSNGHSHSTSKSNRPLDRITPTPQSRPQSRTVKHAQKSTFGSAVRPVTMTPDNPFSRYISATERTDHASATERENIRQYILTNYTSIQEDNPNLAYLVEMCINSPTKDLHPVMQTHAFLDLMQYNDMDKICAEIFHFYVGITQCRGGHDKVGDDVVMCDCDGRVPLCFSLAFMSLLRDYLEVKKDLNSIHEILAPLQAGDFLTTLDPVISSAISRLISYNRDAEMSAS